MLEHVCESLWEAHTIAQVESDPHAQLILAKHWPSVARFDDVKAYKGQGADIVCGGFPCQDISPLGSKEGLKGQKSGLWSEFYRVIKESNPAVVVIENSNHLRTRGLAQVVQDLAEIGYACAWHTLQAREAGIPQRRPRLFLLAYLYKGGLVGSPAIRLQRPEIRQVTEAYRRDATPLRPVDWPGSKARVSPEPGFLRSHYGNPRGGGRKRATKPSSPDR